MELAGILVSKRIFSNSGNRKLWPAYNPNTPPLHRHKYQLRDFFSTDTGVITSLRLLFAKID
jgi:hypothetical protein